MIKKILNIFILFVLCALALNGCSYFNKKADSPTPREQVCSDLRRQATFDKSVINIDENVPALPTEQAQMVEQYKENNCTDFEKQ